jgi:tetratricopeptide (TPR) repeat protein
LRPVQYITLSIAVALIAIIYWGGKTTPPAPKQGANRQPSMAAGMPPSSTPVKPASFDSILNASRMQLSKAAADEVKTVENELAAIRDSSQMADVFIHLAQVWQKNKQLPLAAYYGAKAAKLENSEKKLTFAGQFFLDIMHDTTAPPSVQLWEAHEAEACLQQSITLAPDNDTPKLALASVYLEATGEPMRGVELLLGITREKPDDIPANLMLGRMSIQSGQFDKALGRFETVLKQEPQNTEALYFMAEAYKGKGNKAKAIELFEQCKRIVNKPAFSRDIDQYINSFK